MPFGTKAADIQNGKHLYRTDGRNLNSARNAGVGGLVGWGVGFVFFGGVWGGGLFFVLGGGVGSLANRRLIDRLTDHIKGRKRLDEAHLHLRCPQNVRCALITPSL